MADGDYYASYADVQEVLMNENLGVANATIIDDAAIEKILKITQGKIHLRLMRSDLTSLTNVVFAEVLKEMEIGLLTQMAIRARHMKENNLADTDILTTYWTLSPNITKDMKEELESIRLQLDGVAFNYNIRNGAEIL